MDGYDFLEVCCQGFGSIGCTYLNCSEILILDDTNCGLESGRQVSEKCFERRQAPTDAPIPIIGIRCCAGVVSGLLRALRIIVHRPILCSDSGEMEKMRHCFAGSPLEYPVAFGRGSIVLCPAAGFSLKDFIGSS